MLNFADHLHLQNGLNSMRPATKQNSPVLNRSDAIERTIQSQGRRRLAFFLAAIFILAMVMGTGPGVLLVNRPVTLFGVPLLYAWGVFWYLVQVAVALGAYFAIWRQSGPNGRSTSAKRSDP